MYDLSRFSFAVFSGKNCLSYFNLCRCSTPFEKTLWVLWPLIFTKFVVYVPTPPKDEFGLNEAVVEWYSISKRKKNLHMRLISIRVHCFSFYWVPAEYKIFVVLLIIRTMKRWLPFQNNQRKINIISFCVLDRSAFTLDIGLRTWYFHTFGNTYRLQKYKRYSKTSANKVYTIRGELVLRAGICLEYRP